ncbi:MAG: hypothetical protein AABZ32_02855, partial [Bacteroidota bacterium]
FALKFAAVAAQFGFTAAEITAVTNYAAMFGYLINAVETLTTAKEKFVSYKNLIRSGGIGSSVGAFPVVPILPAAPTAVPAGIFLIIAQIVQRIKNNSANYTEAIGHDLGIIGAEQTIDTSTMKPVLSLVFKGMLVDVQWIKGHAGAVRIEKDSGAGFQFLAIDSVPDYTDTTPITAAATWKYRAMYIINDELVGQWSDVVSITVG